MQSNNSNSRLVYSTSAGSICPGCSKPFKQCICHKIKKMAMPITDGVARISYDIKCRKGKGMTLIAGLAMNEIELLDLAKKLKQRFCTGGSVKDHTIELQGDFRKQATDELRKLGFPVK